MGVALRIWLWIMVLHVAWALYRYPISGSWLSVAFYVAQLFVPVWICFYWKQLDQEREAPSRFRQATGFLLLAVGTSLTAAIPDRIAGTVNRNIELQDYIWHVGVQLALYVPAAFLFLVSYVSSFKRATKFDRRGYYEAED